VAKLYKGGSRADASNAKMASKRSSGIAVPYQPVRGGARVLGTKKAGSTPKGGTLKLKLRKTKNPRNE
jgi:hypothetical protein